MKRPSSLDTVSLFRSPEVHWMRWETTCYSSFADPSERHTKDGTYPTTFVKTSLPYDLCKKKVDQICCICLPGTERAGSFRSKAFTKPLNEVGFSLNHYRGGEGPWTWDSVRFSARANIWQLSPYSTSKVNEVGCICKWEVHAYVMHTPGNTDMAIHSQLVLESF